MVLEKQISTDMRGIVLGLKQTYIREQQRDEVFVPKNPSDVYQLTLTNSASGDGLEKLADACKEALFDVVTGSDTAEKQTKQAKQAALFDLADRYGAALKEKSNLFAPETREALVQQCADLYQTYVESQRVVQDGCSYIPRYPLENFETDAVTIYLAGLAYGYVGQQDDGMRVETDIRVDVTTDPSILSRRNACIEAFQNQPSECVSRIMGISSAADISSLEELDGLTARTEVLLPLYKKQRVRRIMQGKKKTPTERVVQNGKVIVRSEWDKKYVDPLLSQAELLIAEKVTVMREEQKRSTQALLPRLRELMLESGLANAYVSFEERIASESVVDWRPLREALKQASSSNFEARKELEQLIVVGIQEDKSINSLRIVTANALGELDLVKDILSADLQRGEIPQELLNIIDALWVEIAASRDVEMLSDEDCMDILKECIALYELWNREDRGGISSQIGILVPMLVRARMREKSPLPVEFEVQVDRAIDFLKERDGMVGLQLERVDVLKESLLKSPILKIAIKTCPSRRPARLLDESKNGFYEANPYRSDAVSLMLATQEIVWFLQDCGIDVSVDYVVMGTDERDYLEPIYDSLYGSDGLRPQDIQRRLDQFSSNVQKAGQLSLPRCLVSVRQIEDLERDLYVAPYPISYFQRLDAISQEIQQDPSSAVGEALKSGEQSYRERFAEPDGLYAAFSRADIDFAKIARMRMATYSLQMQTILTQYDLLLDTATSPSSGRTTILNREVNKNPSRYGPVSSVYASFGPREELKRKLYEKPL